MNAAGNDSATHNYLHKVVCDYCFPIFWGTKKENGKWTVDNNGTAFLLNCGERTFVVTAAHVYEGFQTRKREVPKIHVQLNNIAFPLEHRLISFVGSNQIDIATFEITDKEICDLKRSILFGNQEGWPPPPPQVNWAALLAGFPGRERINVEEAEYSFGLYSALTPVSSISERHIGCAFQRDGWIDVYGNGLPPEGYDLGGVSGAPLLIVLESDAKIISWRLAGVIYNASSTIGEIMLAHHASYINCDGTLRA